MLTRYISRAANISHRDHSFATARDLPIKIPLQFHHLTRKIPQWDAGECFISGTIVRLHGETGVPELNKSIEKWGLGANWQWTSDCMIDRAAYGHDLEYCGGWNENALGGA
ncbi:MAG: hypothetical protein K1X67_14675 [Fimbriimonadaceae bacterium]|nr:hypothetical protein [Fimbriimonadaceae bacterium]